MIEGEDFIWTRHGRPADVLFVISWAEDAVPIFESIERAARLAGSQRERRLAMYRPQRHWEMVAGTYDRFVQAHTRYCRFVSRRS